MSTMGTTSTWLNREVMFHQKRQLVLIAEEGMKELVKVVKRPEPPKGDVQTLAFIMKNQY